MNKLSKKSAEDFFKRQRVTFKPLPGFEPHLTLLPRFYVAFCSVSVIIIQSENFLTCEDMVQNTKNDFTWQEERPKMLIAWCSVPSKRTLEVMRWQKDGRDLISDCRKGLFIVNFVHCPDHSQVLAV